ncbi:Pentatricopeptide repeat-containing protein At1g05670, mitochondrial [Linum perenne]
MKRSAFHLLGRTFQMVSRWDCPVDCLQFSVIACLSQRLAFSSSSKVRPFPDYSPKKPTIRDSELVHQISSVIRLRRCEPIRRVLKPFESKLRSDHVVWVLMSIKNDYGLVLDFFNWVCFQRDPNLEARCIVIQLAAASKDLKAADELIRDFWMKPNLDVGHAFTLFVERLIYTYKDWGSDPHVFDVFFQVLVEVGLLAEAKTFFEKLLNYGIVVSAESCNLYLSQLSNNPQGLVMALKVYREFSEVGVCWNTASYNKIISTLCQLGRLKEAHTLLLQMELKGFPPDVVSYSTIINGYCQSAELEVVLHLIDEMQFKGLKPNMYTYNSIMLLLFATGNVSEIDKVFKEMIHHGVTPDNVVYTTLIHGFCKLGNTQAAYKLFHEMQARRVIPDLITYTAIICGFSQNGNMLEAEKLFAKMLSQGVQPDEVTYSALVDGYCKLGEMKKAFSLHNQMVRHGIVPNVITYTTLTDGLCKIGEVDTANELLQEMLTKGLKPNVWTYNSMVNGLCKVGNLAQALKLKEEMAASGIHPDTVTYTTLMDAYCKMGEMDKAGRR